MGSYFGIAMFAVALIISIINIMITEDKYQLLFWLLWTATLIVWSVNTYSKIPELKASAEYSVFQVKKIMYDAFFKGPGNMKDIFPILKKMGTNEFHGNWRVRQYYDEIMNFREHKSFRPKAYMDYQLNIKTELENYWSMKDKK